MTDPARFLAKRQALVKAWPWAAGFLFVLLAGFVIYLFVRTPLMVNPFLMAETLAENGLEPATLSLYAALTPVFLDTVLFLLLILILFLIDRMWAEKKFLNIIQDLKGKRTD